MNENQLLDELYEEKAKLMVLQNDKARLIESVIPAEVKQAIEEINAEFDSRIDGLRASIETLEKEIKGNVALGNKTVKGAYLMAVFNKGRVNWDNASLDGYMASHPEIERFRKIGEPYVTIRAI